MIIVVTVIVITIAMLEAAAETEAAVAVAAEVVAAATIITIKIIEQQKMKIIKILVISKQNWRNIIKTKNNNNKTLIAWIQRKRPFFTLKNSKIIIIMNKKFKNQKLNWKN